MYGEQSVIAENRVLFYKENTNSDVHINILKRYIPKIKELVQDPFIVIRDNASYHVVNKQKNWLKEQSKGNFRFVRNLLDLNSILNVWE